jgi:putative restriction endonuclease
MGMRNNWSRDEHVLAFALYSQIPFGTIHVGNPKIKELAKILGRTVGSVSYKLANFSRLDPFLRRRGIKGLPHGAKGEEEVWKEFVEKPEALAFESERLTAERIGKSVEELTGIETDDLPADGREREAIVRIRVNQCFFRRRVLSVYEFKCCVTGLTAKPLLVASHVIPWAEDSANRLNPKNGLCLNALHDRAFDRHLMWIDDGFIIRLSRKLRVGSTDSKQTVDWLASFEGKPLQLPKNFQPDPALLAKHAARCHA